MSAIEHSGWNRADLNRKADTPQTAHPSLRRGQAIYNAAYRDNPAIAQLAGTEFDPFYSDDKIEAFLEKIGAK